MKKHTNLWVVMFLAISLLLPVYSMAQTTPTLTLESYTTGDRIKGAPIKSFFWGTDGNLVVYLDGPFTFAALDPPIQISGTSVTPPATVNATQGASITFIVTSSANATLTMEVSPESIADFPQSTGSGTFTWNTAENPNVNPPLSAVALGSYLAVFQALDTTVTPNLKSQLVVMINIVSSVQYTVTTAASPAGAAATLTGAGPYSAGAPVTVATTAANGYTFSNWTENSSAVSASASYQFTMPSNGRNLVANFTSNTPQQYSVTTTASPAGAAATLTGAGSYVAGASVTVATTAANGYTFSNWTEGSTAVSTSASYQFIMPSNGRSLVANFTANTPPPGGCTNPLNQIAPKSGVYYGLDDLTLSAGTVRTYCLPTGTLYANGNFTRLVIETYSLGVVAGGDIALKLTSPDGSQQWTKDVPTTSDETLIVQAGWNYAGQYVPQGNWTFEITAKQSSRIRIWWYMPY